MRKCKSALCFKSGMVPNAEKEPGRRWTRIAHYSTNRFGGIDWCHPHHSRCSDRVRDQLTAASPGASPRSNIRRFPAGRARISRTSIALSVVSISCMVLPSRAVCCSLSSAKRPTRLLCQRKFPADPCPEFRCCRQAPRPSPQLLVPSGLVNQSLRRQLSRTLRIGVGNPRFSCKIAPDKRPGSDAEAAFRATMSWI